MIVEKTIHTFTQNF